MPVIIHFANGNTRPFDSAAFANRHGGVMVVSDQETVLAQFDAEQVLYAVVKNQDGEITAVVEGARIIPLSSRTHRGGLVVTIHQYGAHDWFGHDLSDQQGPAVGPIAASLIEAQDIADRRVAEERNHRCD